MAPSDDELEIIVFGPGYGEAIAVHLGGGIWILVDSCINPDVKEPASYHYLQSIGVKADQIKAIIASHWHDDHVRGISNLVKSYPNAEFMISAAFSNTEASAFLAAYTKENSAGLSRGTTELYEAIKSSKNYSLLSTRQIILQDLIGGRQVLVTALSPVPEALAQILARFASYIPRLDGTSPVNHAPELPPNLEAVAIHIDFGGDAAILGSDLEDHAMGWSAVVNNPWCLNRAKGSAYKISHHGSATGDHQSIWSNLLQDNPFSCTTPYNKSNKLPTADDRLRIRSKSRESFISSMASSRPSMDHDTEKRLSDMCENIAILNSGFGAVRFRKQISAPSWNVELFGRAGRI